MESTQKGFRRMRRQAFRKIRGQRASQCNSTDLSRAMVVMSQRVNQTKTSLKVRQAVLDLLGTLIDEEA